MKRRSRAGGKSVKKQRRKAVTAKRRNAPNAVRGHSAGIADRKTEVARLTSELKEAREQLTATSELLKVISSSPGELTPVFEAILENATRICQAGFGTLNLYDGEVFRRVALHNPTPQFAMRRGEVIRPHPESGFGYVARTKQISHIEDARTRRAYLEGDEANVKFVDLTGARTVLAVPMLKGDELLGLVAIYRQEVRPFTDKQIELVKNFAAQAVIAIENTRLLKELRESLEHQTATAEVLQVINASPGALAPVFEAILEKAHSRCAAAHGSLGMYDGEMWRPVAMRGYPEALAERLRQGTSVSGNPLLGPLLDGASLVHITDMAGIDHPIARANVECGIHTLLIVPLRKDGALIGTISAARHELHPFSDKQIELLTNFAAQAVIAIENTRLLNELHESLEQQTATSDVLSIISSSPGELEPVFKAMLENATRLCDARYGTMWLRDGDAFRAAALHGPLPPAYIDLLRSGTLFHPSPDTPTGRVAQTRQPVQVPDLSKTRAYLDREPVLVAAVEVAGIRTMFSVPMLKENELVGTISIYRQEILPFTDKQIELVTNFAAQAVIAIENTRLLDELRQSLQQQTATAEVLKVISRSTFDLQAVLDTLVESAAGLCEAETVVLARVKDATYHFEATHGTSREFDTFVANNPAQINRGTGMGRALIEGKIVHIQDVLADTEYTFLEGQRLAGFRTILNVPLLREGTPIGVIALGRRTVLPFTEKQIELASTFADQAVIAIENVRLFDEVQAKTRDLSEALIYQTESGNILRVIASSPTDVGPVLKAIVESACELCDAYDAVVLLRDGDDLLFSAHHGPIPIGLEKWPINRNWTAGRAFLDRKPVHVHDLLSAEGTEFPDGRELSRRMGHRSILSVPLLREGESVGVIVVRRSEVHPFSDKQIALLQTFADQAVIAIENVRLFDDVQKRTQELSESLQQQTATANVLKVISRSTFNLQTVLNTLVESAAKLCEAEQSIISQRDGNAYKLAANFGFSPEYVEYAKRNPFVLGRGTVTGRAALEGKVVHVPDVLADPEYNFIEGQKVGGFRTILGVPLLREGVPIGVFGLTRPIVKPFTDKQIALVTTFADQAVIAIENVRLFDEIQDKSRQLAEASKHKSQFLANMSHELRTPLNAILGYTELILEKIYGDTPDKMRTVLQRIESNGRHLLGLINDVLDLSKIEAGQLNLSISEYSLKNVIQTVFSAIEPLATGKKIGLKIDVPANLPQGHGDERRLTQVLLNLVGNAIKFTDVGEVSIKGSTANGSFKVEVHDTGPGISLADQAKLFEEFQQADNSITKQKGGTGLGLAISKRIIELHGGRIWLESDLGHGSTFAFTLPVTVEKQARPT